MTNTAVVERATNAIESAEEVMQLRVQKRAAARLALDKVRREYFEDCETERMLKVIEQMSRRRGRPETISEAQLIEIIELHAEGEPLKLCCEAFGITRLGFMWRVNKSSDLLSRLAVAREQSAHSKVDGAWAIARTEPDVERARLLTDLCRWEVSKVLPTLYGDRLKVEAPDGVVFSLNIGQVVDSSNGSDKPEASK